MAHAVLDRFFFYFFSRQSKFSRMRPKIVIIVLLAGAAGLAGIFFLKHLGDRPPPEPVASVQPAVSAPAPSPAPPQVSPATNSLVVVVPVTTPTPPRIAARTNAVTAPDADSIQKKIDRLQELQANDDAASLKEILAELTNTNKTIRHEAIEATIQFGGHTAVPVLRDLASRTWDPGEKKELLDAADFLELPTLTEIRAQNPNAKIIPQP
jgi:hypothetical protein